VGGTGPGAFCAQCGHELRRNVRFCAKCGKPVLENADSQTTPAATARVRPDRIADPAERLTASAAATAPSPSGFLDDFMAGRIADSAFHATASGPEPDDSEMGRGAATSTVPNRSRRGVRWPIVVFIVFLIAAAGAGLAAFLSGHSDSHSVSEKSSSSTSVKSSASSAPAQPPRASPSATATTTPSSQAIQGIAVSTIAVRSDPDASAVAATMAVYFGGIDSKHYAQAWDLLSSALQGANPFSSFAAALRTTQDSRIIVQSLRHEPGGAVLAALSFRSYQAPQYGPEPGETCTDWSLEYWLVPFAGTQVSAPGSGSPSAGSTPSFLISKVSSAGDGQVPC